jgi:hypothetical protein
VPAAFLAEPIPRLDDEKTTRTLEAKAGELFASEVEKHKARIRKLPEARREA